jgi:hypothetical protein
MEDRRHSTETTPYLAFGNRYAMQVADEGSNLGTPRSRNLPQAPIATETGVLELATRSTGFIV